MKKLFKNKKKAIRVFMLTACLMAALSCVCFASEVVPVQADTASLLTDLGSMVTSILTQATAVFAFLTSAEVLPFVLLGIAVSLITVAIGWVFRIMWGR